MSCGHCGVPLPTAAALHEINLRFVTYRRRSHHRDALDFDQNSGMREVGHRDQGAARKSSVWIHFVPDLDEPVAVTWIIDRDRHSDEIGELAANAIERPVDQREAGSRLGFEIVHDRFSVQVRILWNINGFATWINPLCS